MQSVAITSHAASDKAEITVTSSKPNHAHFLYPSCAATHPKSHKAHFNGETWHYQSKQSHGTKVILSFSFSLSLSLSLSLLSLSRVIKRHKTLCPPPSFPFFPPPSTWRWEMRFLSSVIRRFGGRTVELDGRLFGRSVGPLVGTHRFTLFLIFSFSLFSFLWSSTVALAAYCNGSFCEPPPLPPLPPPLPPLPAKGRERDEELFSAMFMVFFNGQFAAEGRKKKKEKKRRMSHTHTHEKRNSRKWWHNNNADIDDDDNDENHDDDDDNHDGHVDGNYANFLSRGRFF